MLNCITKTQFGRSSIAFIGTKTECRKEFKALTKDGPAAWGCFWIWYPSVEQAVNQIKQESVWSALSQ